jgi:PAS domain S-box-containing protein
LPSVDPAAVQGLVAQMATAAVVAGVLFGCDRLYKRHFLRYWIWSWLAVLVSLAVAGLSLFGRTYFPSHQPWRTLVAGLGVTAGYLQLVWILFGNREMAKGERLPRRITRWVPITVAAATFVVAGVPWSGDALQTRLFIRAGVKTIGFLVGAVTVALGAFPGGSLGRPLMAVALLSRALEQGLFVLGGTIVGSAVFQLAHAGVVDITLNLLLSLAMVLWLLEGERERAIVLSREREEAERARADAERVRAAQVRLTGEIVNGAAQGIVAFDREFKVVLWNPYAERLTGWPASEIIGMSLPEFFRRAPPPQCEERIAAALRGEAQSAEYPAPLPGNPWVSALFSPLRGADGDLHGAVLLVSDVTERKQAEADRTRLEAALLAAASDWKTTFDAVDVLIVVLDSEGRVARLNRAAVELAGASYAKSLGRPLLEVAEGEPWVTGAALAARLAESGSRVAEIARDRATGHVWGLSVTRFANPEGGQDRVVIVGRDITPVVRLEESLRRKEHMSVMGALVAGVAHEVRNPLFGVSSTVDAFEARFGDVEKHQRYLSTLRTQVDRLRRLMSDLLEYGKPLTSEPSPENIADVVGEAVRSCELLARRSQVQVEDKTAGDLPRVTMDRSRMVQVVQNVIQNAIEHVGPGGKVEIEAGAIRSRGGGERVRLSVRDTGPGFEEADIPRLFEPFFTRRRGGTGLGLSIVQRIVEQTGGRVTAQNHPEGGALVTIELPAGEAPETEVGRVRAAI